MRRLRSSAILFAMAALCLAQSASDLVTPEIRRVGKDLACLCGSCKNTVGDCPMLGCHYSNPAREQIAAGLKEGKADKQIVDAFVEKEGLRALAVPPAEGFNLLAWVMPFAAIGMGLVAIALFIRRFRKPSPVPAVDNRILERYHDRIEKDLAKLD